jgi:hypothetical protein
MDKYSEEARDDCDADIYELICFPDSIGKQQEYDKIVLF